MPDLSLIHIFLAVKCRTGNSAAGIFSPYYLKEYAYLDIDRRKLMLIVAKERGKWLLLLWALGFLSLIHIWILYSLVAFLGILFGSDAVSTLMDAIPDVVMNGLTVCGGLLPAVGMAMLMKMLWDKKICMFYFLGFVLSAYMNLPLIAIAVIRCV